MKKKKRSGRKKLALRVGRSSSSSSADLESVAEEGSDAESCSPGATGASPGNDSVASARTLGTVRTEYVGRGSAEALPLLDEEEDEEDKESIEEQEQEQARAASDPNVQPERREVTRTPLQTALLSYKDKKKARAASGERPDVPPDATPEEILRSASTEHDGDIEIRRMHAYLIADARRKFPTREALEDSIAERRAEAKATLDCGFSVDRETLSRAALADDEVRKLR